MSLDKLLALLCDRSLFCTRLDNYDDPWEGWFPRSFIDATNPKFTEQNVIFPEDLHRKATSLVSDAIRQSIFANCWHASAHESAALWNQYSGSNGFAIKSTIKRIKDAVTCEFSFHIGRVTYCDVSTYEYAGKANALVPAFLKRRSFEHENEVRIVVQMFFDGIPQTKPRRRELLNSGVEPREYVQLPVDLTKLVDSVLLSPTAPSWLLSHVRETLDRFDLSGIDVSQSNLYSPIIY